MELRLIRHATMVVTTAAGKLLVDPLFSPAGAMPPIDNSANDRRNPLVELPVSVTELKKVDAVLVTHTHRDHFDAAAAEGLPKEIALFCQPADEQKLRDLEFARVNPVADSLTWGTLRISRTGGQHGTGVIGEKMGPVSGYVLQQAGEPTLYIAGDTVWCPVVADSLAQYQPDVIVLFAGAAQFLTGDPITMSAADVAAVCRAAPTAQVVVVHMESFNHCLLTRQQLSDYLAGEGLLEQVTIPSDGDVLEFQV
ncbi:MAG: MBL fold metallo-hydrolase [Negativicutes bacterium]|nr:MBL fold metallo-hydrolase [Negativicutes bacterium]